MSKIVAIVQARTGSNRLPGKVLEPLVPGKSLLTLLLERLTQSKTLSQIVVATSSLPQDDPVVSTASTCGVAVFRGSEQDVLARYAGAAHQFKADIVVRLCADSPLHDADIVDRAVQTFTDAEGRADLATNMLKETFPYGTAAEVLASDTLFKIDQIADHPQNREHVTHYLYNTAGYQIINIENDRDLSFYRWAIDYPEDLIFVREVYKQLYTTGGFFSWQEVVALLEKNPNILQLNLNRNERLFAQTVGNSPIPPRTISAG